MSHDPLCPSYGLCPCGCEYDSACLCVFIVKVRGDESANCFEHEKRGREQAIQDCIAAVEQQADWSGVSNDSNVSGHLFWETVNKMNAAMRALLEGEE